jgi:hypothetical protein
MCLGGSYAQHWCPHGPATIQLANPLMQPLTAGQACTLSLQTHSQCPNLVPPLLFTPHPHALRCLQPMPCYTRHHSSTPSTCTNTWPGINTQRVLRQPLRPAATPQAMSHRVWHIACCAVCSWIPQAASNSLKLSQLYKETAPLNKGEVKTSPHLLMKWGKGGAGGAS